MRQSSFGTIRTPADYIPLGHPVHLIKPERLPNTPIDLIKCPGWPAILIILAFQRTLSDRRIHAHANSFVDLTYTPPLYPARSLFIQYISLFLCSYKVR